MKNKKKANIIDFPTSPTKLERQVEAILFAASEPLDVETIEKRLQTSINLNKKSEEKFYKNKFTANLDIYYQGQTIYLKDGKSLFKLSE